MPFAPADDNCSRGGDPAANEVTHARARSAGVTVRGYNLFPPSEECMTRSRGGQLGCTPPRCLVVRYWSGLAP